MTAAVKREIKAAVQEIFEGIKPALGDGTTVVVPVVVIISGVVQLRSDVEAEVESESSPIEAYPERVK
jgi:hypothetical protein